ncbi:hypothetical protein [Corynebacterium glyciniphilum]|uniref:hypothetical protein n=1 Tax=Corynebacterium glyciniphilum TaxID=1404244 RepID=UPI00264F1ECC|nr:hypothetical protein [Corynebacterium glyciniphilum]MDN5682465.1 hypothetical protein [Corynebacterium glyciniphilum]MDN6707019.1 hypothetical protein [Corynebacterium glyciniphilum]
MDAKRISVPLLTAGIVASVGVLVGGIASGWSPLLWIVAALPIIAQVFLLADVLRQHQETDPRAVVVSLLFLAALGVLLPIAVPDTNWLGVVGWTVALVALIAALWTLFGHARRESRPNRG